MAEGFLKLEGFQKEGRPGNLGLLTLGLLTLGLLLLGLMTLDDFDLDEDPEELLLPPRLLLLLLILPTELLLPPAEPLLPPEEPLTPPPPLPPPLHSTFGAELNMIIPAIVRKITNRKTIICLIMFEPFMMEMNFELPKFVIL